MAGRSLILQIVTAMIAFAANSVLCRMALKGGHIDPISFSNIRLISGAIVLLPFVLKKGSCGSIHRSIINGFLLMLYAVLFSVAYIHLDTGTGALLLFGVVQLTMIIYGLLRGETLTVLRGTGLVLALAGIALLLLPGASAPPLKSAIMMAVSGLAWAAYSVRGRTSVSPASTTATNFLMAVPFTLLTTFFFGVPPQTNVTGVLLAIASGALASAGAYVLWYAVLPRIGSVTASTVQLSVPCLAMLGGVLFLGEPFTWRMAVSMGAVLTGIWLVMRRTD